MKNSQKKVNPWISLIGLLLLLVGVYMSVRTVVNLAFFDKYPTGGVMITPMSFFGGMPYEQREEDCTMMGQVYFKPDGMPRQPSEDEKKMAIQQEKLCIDSVKRSRETAKINDIASSLLFVFMGAGVLIGKRYF